MTCPTCGPLPAPALHDRCHAIAGLRSSGCGHPLNLHTPGMRCRVCRRECARADGQALDLDDDTTSTSPDPDPGRLFR